MDVLEFWNPVVDWSRFSRGPLSSQMWSYFQQVVELCHAYEHWKQVAAGTRLAPPPEYTFPESKYQRKKRQDEWKREIARHEGHMHRTAFLASDAIAQMSYLLSNDDSGTPDRNLYWALRGAVAHQLAHDQARYKAAASQLHLIHSMRAMSFKAIRRKLPCVGCAKPA